MSLPVEITAEHFSLNTYFSDISTEQVFSVFADEPWSMWLDSCKSSHIDCQFDIIVWQPDITLSTYADKSHICRKKNSTASADIEISTEEPLALLNKLHLEFFGENIKSHKTLPFIGGALGYFSYDLGRRFEKLPELAIQDIHAPDMAIGIYSQAIVYDHKNKQYWLVCPKEKRNSLTKQLLKKFTDKINKKKITSLNDFALTSAWHANMTKAQYSEKFAQVQQYLLSGDCYQINLAQRFSASYQGNEFQAYQALRASNQTPFSAFIRLENYAMLSLSPERFLQVRQGKVQSKPIKGTKPRSDDQKIDIMNAKALQLSEKDRAENVMIVDLLRNDISKTCQVGSVKVPELFAIESFPAVHHLVSTVEGILSPQYTSSDLLRGAFPGGSITGAPKIRAMEIIEQLEPHRRHLYCGSIGYISACGNMDTSITIRTLVCESNDVSDSGFKKIHCWAGGGLVADSSVESEYQETLDKVSKILPTLSLLQPSQE